MEDTSSGGYLFKIMVDITPKQSNLTFVLQEPLTSKYD